MACYHPIPAFRTRAGSVVLQKEPPNSVGSLSLPCGGCLGCRTEKARQWALRCHLELRDHPSAVFSTLTYADDRLPPTLQKSDLQLWLKRLRKALDVPVRFFAAGEYGERTNRPHYHAILYGPGIHHAKDIERTWGHGHCRTEAVTPARIAYTAGYCQKKIGYRREPHERVDPRTGEVYTWQPPFINMSRNPGIGSTARDRYSDSWKLFAVHNGVQLPAPRYLHQRWQDNATDDAQEDLDYQKSQLRLAMKRDLSRERLRAEERLAEARHKLRASRRGG